MDHQGAEGMQPIQSLETVMPNPNLALQNLDMSAAPHGDSEDDFRNWLVTEVMKNQDHWKAMMDLLETSFDIDPTNLDRFDTVITQDVYDKVIALGSRIGQLNLNPKNFIPFNSIFNFRLRMQIQFT